MMKRFTHDSSLIFMPSDEASTLKLVSLCSGAAAILLLLYARRTKSRAHFLQLKALDDASGNKKEGAAGHAGNFEKDGFFYKLEVQNRTRPLHCAGERCSDHCVPFDDSSPPFPPPACSTGFENERQMLQQLSSKKDEPMRPFAPEFHGVEVIDGKRYLKMRSLIDDFDPSTLCLCDIKMGVRCFAESELQSTKPRVDLYERLLTLDPSVPTAEERAARSITKARWMKIRDALSSTTTLGFRVDAVITPTRRRKAFGDLWRVKQDAEVVEVLRCFLPEQCSAAQQRKLMRQILARLEEFEACLHASRLFRECEVIGSSLLFAADASGKLGVWMLDFGLTGPSPTGSLQHDVQWVEGNHEDGYLIGVANLRRLWGKALDEV